jgi:hypothetical protein
MFAHALPTQASVHRKAAQERRRHHGIPGKVSWRLPESTRRHQHSAPTAGSSQEPPCWHPREEQSGPRRAFARPAPPVPANNGRAAQRRRQEAERACCPSSASTEAEQRIFQPMAALRVPVLGRSEPCSGPCTTVQLTAQRPGCSIGTPMRHRADGMEAQGHSADGHRRGRAAARESGHPSEPYCQCRIEGD